MRSMMMATWLAFSLAACSECDPRSPRSGPPAAPGPRATIRRVDPPASAGAIGLTPVTAGDEVIATWIEPTGAAWRVRFARLDGQTREWSEPTTVRESDRLLAHWEDPPVPLRAPSGYYVAMLEGGREAEASSVHLASSADGLHWRALGPLHDDATETEHGHVALAVEGDLVRAVWVDGRQMATGGPMSLRTALIGADGAITDASVLDPRVCECCQTTLVATTDGPLVAYRDRSESELRDIFSVRRTPAGWTAPENVYADGWMIRGCPVNGPSAAAIGRRVALAWYTAGETGARVRVAFSDDAGARFARPWDVDLASPLGRVDVEWSSGGDALVSWLGIGEREGEAVVRLVRVAPDGRVGSALDVASTGAAQGSGFPRIARLGEAVLVSWTEVGPPTHVRAALIDPDDVPAPTAASREESPRAPAPLAIGSALPDLTLTDLQGHPVTLSSMRGRPVVLSFFAMWCAPCRDEYPVLATLAREHGDRVQVVGVSVDDADLGLLADFARAQQMDYTVLDDREDRVSQLFGVPPIPATFVFDSQGVLTYRRVGGGAELERELRDAVAAAL